MRVVFLNQYYAPAEAPTAQILDSVARHLAESGHDVEVICSRRNYPDPRPIARRTEIRSGVRVHRTWTTGFGRASRVGRLMDYVTFGLGAALKLALGRRPDVVVSLTTPPMLPWLAMRMARLKGARSVFWAMDLYPDLAFELGVLRRDTWIGRGLTYLAQRTVAGADCIIALGPTMATRLRDAGGRNVVVVHNWADGDAIRPDLARENRFRAEWSRPGEFLVLYSGNLGLAHEFDTVVEAAALLRDRPEVVFIFVGSGPRLAELQREVERRGLTNVRFRPHVERSALGEALTAGDLHLITLRPGMQGYLVPSKVYGILAAGIPPIYVGPAEGEIGRIVAEGRVGVRVANGDGRGLCDAILAYRDGETRRANESSRARSLFETRFDMPLGVEAVARAVLGTPPDDSGQGSMRS